MPRSGATIQELLVISILEHMQVANVPDFTGYSDIFDTILAFYLIIITTFNNFALLIIITLSMGVKIIAYFLESNRIDFIRDIAIKAITIENGSAPMIITDFKAPMPPAINRTAITEVKISPQRMMCLTCFWRASPAEEIVLMIKIAESADVTRYVKSKITITTDIKMAILGERIKFIVSKS